MSSLPASMASTKVRILQVEDSAADAELIIDDLRADGMQCEVCLVETEADYVEALESFAPDIVLSDLAVPGFGGERALALLRQCNQALPFIFVSGILGEEAAVQALKRGATDYVLKQNTARLAQAVRRALRDATEQQTREHMEAELTRGQRFESLALLASGISHDLRNLLQPLLLAADTLDNYKGDARLTRLGQMVHDCATRGLDMVSTMLSFARGARHVEHVRLGAVMDALDLLLKGSAPRAIDLHINVENPELEFVGNHTELQQCLLNLCLNAMQAMPDGGTLEVCARQLTLDADFLAHDEGVAPGRYLELAVSDTGSGMSPDVMERLFEPFFTTKRDGTGLGLLSCRRIVSNHDGLLRVDSTPGEGTVFRVYLPLEDSQAGSESPAIPTGQGEHVLVVTEDAIQLSFLSHLLESYGYTVTSTQSGTAAVQAIDQNGLPQLLVLDADLHLFTGVRTLAALLERDYHGAVVLLSHPDRPTDMEGLPPIRHLSIVDKSIKADALLCAVRAGLDSARSG